jgi:hypothetical protein
LHTIRHQFLRLLMLTGHCLGLGIKHLFTARLYAVAELQQAYFDRENLAMAITTNGVTTTFVNNLKPRSLGAMLGVGLQF